MELRRSPQNAPTYMASIAAGVGVAIVVATEEASVEDHSDTLLTLVVAGGECTCGYVFLSFTDCSRYAGDADVVSRF